MGEFCPVVGAERILIAADDCEYCEGAVREGINLAKTCHSKVTVVAVTQVNMEVAALAPNAVEDMLFETKAFLESVRMRAFKEGVACEVVSREGDEAADYIIEEAKNRVAGIIVMGSVAERVVGLADCPTLAVKA